MTSDGSFNKGLYQQVCVAFYRTIEASYCDDGSRPTRNETERRFLILERTFRMLRHDYQWSVERILFVLPRALRAELDGMKFDPAVESRIWTPSS